MSTVETHSNDLLDTSLVNAEKGTSLWADAWVRLRKNRLALAGLYILIFLSLISLLTPWIAPYGYEQQNLALGHRRRAGSTGLAPIFLAATCSPA